MHAARPRLAPPLALPSGCQRWQLLGRALLSRAHLPHRGARCGFSARGAGRGGTARSVGCPRGDRQVPQQRPHYGNCHEREGGNEPRRGAGLPHGLAGHRCGRHSRGSGCGRLRRLDSAARLGAQCRLHVARKRAQPRGQLLGVGPYRTAAPARNAVHRQRPIGFPAPRRAFGTSQKLPDRLPADQAPAIGAVGAGTQPGSSILDHMPSPPFRARDRERF